MSVPERVARGAIVLIAVVSSAAAKPKPTLLTWSKVPVCLDASAPSRSSASTASALDWKSPQHTVRTAAGAVGLKLHDDEAALVLNDQPVAIGVDSQGRSIALGDRSMSVRGFPDCDAPDYLFITPTAEDQTVSRQWFVDAHTPSTGEFAAVEFPGHYGADTVVSLRDGTLTVSSGAADGDETAFQYHAGPVHGFVQAGAAPKYLAVVGASNTDFYRNSAASDVVLRSAGQDTFDQLRVRTAVGKARLFRGRYLIVEGSADGDFQRHGVVVVDTVKDAALYVLCDDEAIESGAIVAASRVRASALDRGGEDVLAAFRFAGLTLAFDDGATLACDGECHGER
jgi:hypothetical protein